jgi:predicted nucleic acid-binding protein
MTNLIVDASVAVRWFVPTLAWPKAVELLKSGQTFAAPELILAEAGNAFWKAVRAGYMTPAEMQGAIARFPMLFDTLVPLHELVRDAAAKAVSLAHPVYDCFYLALAQREGAPLVTADKRLAAAARGLPGVEVRLLSEL